MTKLRYCLEPTGSACNIIFDEFEFVFLCCFAIRLSPHTLARGHCYRLLADTQCRCRGLRTAAAPRMNIAVPKTKKACVWFTIAGFKTCRRGAWRLKAVHTLDVTTRFDSILNVNDRAVCTGDRTFDEDQVLFGIDAVDAQILNGNACIAALTGHFAVLHDTAWC